MGAPVVVRRCLGPCLSRRSSATCTDRPGTPRLHRAFRLLSKGRRIRSVASDHAVAQGVYTGVLGPSLNLAICWNIPKDPVGAPAFINIIGPKALRARAKRHGKTQSWKIRGLLGSLRDSTQGSFVPRLRRDWVKIESKRLSSK